MQHTTWMGATAPSAYSEKPLAFRHQLADAARDYNWAQVLTLLEQDASAVNLSRPGGKSGFTPLHQAAHGNAPVEVVQKLLDFGAWRSLRNADGARAVDIAQQQGHGRLVSLLEPLYVHEVPDRTLRAIEIYFHAVITVRAQDLLKDSRFLLPQLTVLLELSEPRMNCPIPGMYGGFSYWLEETGDEAKLVSESACRVVGGSGQRHEVTGKGSQLVAEGFV